MELPVINSEGQQGEPLQVSDTAFGVKFNEALIHQVVMAQQAGTRSGTRAQKNRAAVRGGGRTACPIWKTTWRSLADGRRYG